MVSEGNQIHAASFLGYCIYAVSTLYPFAPNLQDIGDCSSKDLLKASSRSLNPRLHFSLLLPQVLKVSDSNSSYCPLYPLILPSLPIQYIPSLWPCPSNLPHGQAAAHPVCIYITYGAL